MSVTLADLTIGDYAVIKGFEDSDLSLKLMEMGVLPGERFCLEQIAPLGDPFIISLSDYRLILRKNEASIIVVERGGRN